MLDSIVFKTALMTIASAVVSYLLGSVNFAVIISKLFYKKDVRDFGSGNAGMTNVLRTFGVLPAVFTLIGDFGKSVGAMLFSRWLFSLLLLEGAAETGMYVSAMFVFLGHIYPIFFKFRGGKGVLTCAGIFFVLDWQICLVCIGIFAIVSVISGYVSLGSIIAMACAPVLTLAAGLLLRPELPFTGVLCQSALLLLIASFSIFMHRENIKRLIAGTENSFKKKKQH